MIFIAAPFGNYLRRKDTVSVTGTFTVAPRPGRLKAIIKTLRYTKQGWRNKLGLRNPGLHAGMLKTNYKIMFDKSYSDSDKKEYIDKLSVDDCNKIINNQKSKKGKNKK